MPTLRAFIAVRISRRAADGSPLSALLRQFASFGRAVHAVDPDNLHLTLRFLGDMDVDRLAHVTRAADAAAAAVSRFDIALRGVGAFPDPRRPRVIWAGVTDPTPLDALAAHLDSSLAGVDGIAIRDKPFTAHLTLARVKGKPPGACIDLTEDHADRDLGRYRIAAIHLIESTLTRAGPVYRDRHVAALRAANRR
jgi:2'-5' RNA ligase